MELAEAIFFKKINPGDLLNIDLSVQDSGGGQTYLDLAGISQTLLSQFLEYGSVIARSNPPLGDARSKFGIQAIAIGTEIAKLIEFDPRNSRPNYKISDQRGNRHPAWTQEYGFPHCPENARYARDVNNIPYLLIYIVRTNLRRYYAGFVNSRTMPVTWPNGIGLEQLFSGDRRGVHFFNQGAIQFNNNSHFPFSILTTISGVDTKILPENILEVAEDVAEYIDSDVVNEIEPATLLFTEFTAPLQPPTVTHEPKNSRKGRLINQERAQRNRTAIGLAGEQAAVEFEKRRLSALGRVDLAEQVEWVSQTKGDGLGYDIYSVDVVGETIVDQFIEVKTTTGGITKPFEISINEVEFSEENPQTYILFRIFEFDINSADIRYYRIPGSIPDNFHLKPTNFLAIPSEK